MRADDSRDLVAQAGSGHQPALEALLDRHLPALRAFVRLRMGRAVRAQEESGDVVQSVCRQVLENLADFRWEGEAGFKQWLYTMATNKLIDRLRHQRAQKRDVQREVPIAAGNATAVDEDLLRGFASLITPSRDAIAREQVARFERAFDRLPDEQREVILLARFLGLPHAEIAKTMARSEGAVRTLLYRALARLSFLVEG